MHITFGMSLDGSDWSQNIASLGEIKMGPLQFLVWLEDCLGLSGVSVSMPERINEYMQKIRHVNSDWCKASFELDSWSTAKQMLAWRDELINAGWDGKSGSSERLKTLSALEADSGLLSPGIPDRLKTVLNELKNFYFSDTLVLQDPEKLLPYLWKSIVDQLRKSGMNVVKQAQPNSCKPEKIQLNGDNEFVLAKECVRFLLAGSNDKTAIICEGDSSVLDGVFRQNGIGRLNIVEKSRWRESLQILPLWLDTLWKPFNPQHFLELLQLPCTPVPIKIGRELTEALKKEPGYGGEAWLQAWDRVKNRFFPDGKIDLQNHDFKNLASVWIMLNEGSFCYDATVPAEKIANRCDFLIKQIAVQIKNHYELALVIEHAKTLKKIVADRTLVKRMELSRILDSIIGTGTTGGQNERERTDFAVFSNPGMIDRVFDTILWWNFTDNVATNSTNWTDDEIKAMPGFNNGAARELENISWHNALNHAEKNIVFFVPKIVNGEAVFPHPLLDELTITKQITDKNTFSHEKLTDTSGKWSFAGRTVSLDKQHIFKPVGSTKIEPNTIAPLRRLSHSQMKTMITCPFQWFLDNYIELKMPAEMQVPTGSRMLGTFAHKVVEKIYNGREILTVENAVSEAKKQIEQLLPSMAAELLLDGKSVERKRICNTLLEAVKELVKKINEKKLLVKGNEKELHGTLDGIDFLGFSDIYLEDDAGGKFVIDMKWSTSTQYEKNLHEDKALQLATYSWLLDSKDLNVQCAYFLFPRHQFICEQHKRWNELWNNAILAWRQRLSEIHSGNIARGFSDENDLKNSQLALPLTASCVFCNYTALCAIMED